MNNLINTVFERLNSPKDIFDEKITKTNLIPVIKELKNHPNDLDHILYEISEADDFSDMSWVVMAINKNYPETRSFLETIIENVKKEYVFAELSDLYESIETKLIETFLASPGRNHYNEYTRFIYHLDYDENLDQLELIILNGTRYTQFTIEDTDRYDIRVIYDILKAIDDACNAKPLAINTMTDNAQKYYEALSSHIEDGSPLTDIELKFLKRELKKGN